MRRIFLLYLMLAVSTGVAGCARSGGEGSGKPTGDSAGKSSSAPGSSARQKATSGIAEALKGKKLANYGSTTIGAAFDGYKYFTGKEWRETNSPNGKIYIDFIGWLDTKSLDAAAVKRGVSAMALDVKFVIEPDGSFFVAMVSRIEMKSDGKSYDYPIENSVNVLNDIYANKEISF